MRWRCDWRRRFRRVRRPLPGWDGRAARRLCERDVDRLSSCVRRATQWLVLFGRLRARQQTMSRHSARPQLHRRTPRPAPAHRLLQATTMLRYGHHQHGTHHNGMPTLANTRRRRKIRAQAWSLFSRLFNIQELEHSTSKQFLIIYTSTSSSLNFGTIVVNYMLIRPEFIQSGFKC